MKNTASSSSLKYRIIVCPVCRETKIKSISVSLWMENLMYHPLRLTGRQDLSLEHTSKYFVDL